MAVPAYASDLADITLSESTHAFVEPTGATAGGTPGDETDYYIQGSQCHSKTFNATSLGGNVRDNGSGVTIASGAAVYTWVYWECPNTLDTLANGGMRIAIGSSTANYKMFYVFGSDTYIYGGWLCVPVDPTLTASSSYGSPTTTRQVFGAVVNNANNVAKGNPFGVDAIRHGREFQCTAGSLADGYATFAGAATYNDNISRRYGQIQAVDGGYLLQGLFVMGTTATAVAFSDSNRNIIIPNHLFVAAAFNGFEVRNSSSTVSWTNIVVAALGTVSKGTFVVTAGTVTLSLCQFTDMSTFTFLASTVATDCTFRRCLAVTAPGSDLRRSKFEASAVAADSSALVWNVNTDPSGLLDNTNFSKGTNAHHAIEFGTSSPTTLNLVGITFSGFNASNAQNDSTLHIKRTSGTVTVNISGGGSTPSYKTAGATVVISNTVTLTLTGLVSGSDIVILTAGTETELVNVDQNSGTTYAYGYTYAAGTYIDVGVFKAGYVPFYIRNYLLASTSASLPVAQDIDRNYNDPA